MVIAGFGLGEPDEDSTVGRTEARVVVDCHVRKEKAEELADPKVGIEADEEEKSRVIVATSRHPCSEDTSEFPSQRRVRNRGLSALPAAECEF